MITHVSATLTGGMLKPDVAIPLADQTRVRLTIEPIPDPPTALAWQTLKARLGERPVHAAGMHPTRDELHERR